jgi:peptidoglycan hydrolase-like protein with peptidoglycan-binding domain
LNLQKFLALQGLLTAIPNGHYGPATRAAIKKFQLAHNIKQTGNMGPLTENEINKY